MITLQRWIKPIKTSFKCIATGYAERIKSGNTKNLKIALLLTWSLSAIILAFSLFSASTIFSFSLMMTTFLCFMGLSFYEVWKKGIVYCLSSKLQNILLHRSLFDMICDIWFIPDIVLYFRVLLLPFFVKVEPSAAINQFQELSPAAQKFFLQKGLVHLLPEYIKNAIVPSQIPPSENSQENHNGVCDASSQNDRQEQIIEKKEAISNSQSHSRNNKFLRKRPQQIISTRHRNRQNIENSSRQNQSAFSEKWDYLEMFLTKKREENLIKKHLPPEPPKKLEFKDYFQVLERFTIFLSKEKFFEKVNSRKLSTIFLISTCSVIAQLYFSKRTRKWCYFTLKILAYIIGFALSTGSLGLLAIKLQHKYENKKRIQQELEDHL